MFAQRFTRRDALKAIGAAAATAPIGTAAIGQDAAPFPLPSGDPNDPVVELFSAYEIDQSNGYTKIIMDHVRPGVPESGTLDVAAIRLALDVQARRNGLREPIIITDYGYDGPDELYSITAQRSEDHDSFFDVLLPAAARNSQRHIVFINVSVFGVNTSGEMIQLHFSPLLQDLGQNSLGRDGSNIRVDTDNGEMIVPYFNVIVSGQHIFDASFSLYPEGTKTNDINRAIGSRMVNVINEHNEPS